MHWLRSHPYALLFAGAGLCFLFIVMLMQGINAPSSNQVVTLSGGSIPQNPGVATIGYTPSDTYSPPATGVASLPTASSSPAPTPAPVYIHVPVITQTSPDQTAVETNNTLEVSAPAPSQSAPDTSAGDAVIADVYAMIPTSVAPLNGPAPVRTEAQQALYGYGNTAGLAVLTFTNGNAGMTDVMQKWLNDRQNSTVEAGMKSLAASMIATGQTLAALPNVPVSAAALNQNLAQSYQSAGTQLLAVVGAGGSDSSLVDAMKTYDATADTFTRSYVALADFFSASGVTFAASDAGSVFSFPGSTTGL